MARRGLLGDSFGAINALFSGLAFTCLIYAILLQQRELRLQQKELRDTREVFAQQTFESTFFRLLQLWISQVELISADRRKPGGAMTVMGFVPNPDFDHLTGKTAISQIWDELQHNAILKSDTPGDVAAMYRTIDDGYELFYSKYGDQVGHYFRSLYRIIKFVHASRNDDKTLYTGLARAQLSSSELALLFYNGLSKHGRDKFKPLIEEYALLKNMDQAYILEAIRKPV